MVLYSIIYSVIIHFLHFSHFEHFLQDPLPLRIYVIYKYMLTNYGSTVRISSAR
ncbi:hypothetical protein Hanom_Chr06g00495001 [Helianthus anomalus]